MNLIIDIGNTIVKWVLFEDNRLTHIERSENPELEILDRLLQTFDPSKILLSSVRKADPRLEKKLSQQKIYIELTNETALPIANTYKTPETLGSDRIAAVIGGRMMIPEEALLVIDAGTCITYDFLDHNDHYQGGAISPGLDMRFKALHTFTGQLPLLNYADQLEPVFVGKSTNESITSGVFFGIIAEMEGIIAKCKEQFDPISVLLTGGNSRVFETHLKNRIFAFPNLQHYGLNRILEYNAKNY